MTTKADQIRERRRAFAAPGSSLDRTVRWLAVGLPALVGVIAALMVLDVISAEGGIGILGALLGVGAATATQDPTAQPNTGGGNATQQ